ncbi:uncharacterized protein K452DRAFT_301256 [Aplosporella prunicola CBS 121167]|uniref:Uncharacterized protein n=1 Tax=Aplosporella prunicola CBS 121167 TaxID=1176127 RepID=A0A6A6B5Q1_9PEZI|nr:uncharacterized protein K452DRAFT_301256 [Aplosporella prunicola CBS 121167]KAF2138297.1 hypothetical protein K452DRAFT_301256 [Aplosporella prunicola CBS 121167]
MSQILKGVAFITGAASGIARQAAITFAKNGVQKLALVDISHEEVKRIASQLEQEYGVEAIGLGVDTTQESEVDEAMRRTVEKFGRIDMAVNCAGAQGPAKQTPDTTLAELEQHLGNNLRGTWLCHRAQLRLMQQQEVLEARMGRGTIVNVASVYGLGGPPTLTPMTPYSVGKHAIVGLTKADGAIYASKGIRINAICPGFVATPLVEQAFENEPVMRGEMLRTPMKRMGSVEEIADAIMFLASPLSSYMAGAAMPVDGGWTAI